MTNNGLLVFCDLCSVHSPIKVIFQFLAPLSERVKLCLLYRELMFEFLVLRFGNSGSVNSFISFRTDMGKFLSVVVVDYIKEETLGGSDLFYSVHS